MKNKNKYLLIFLATWLSITFLKGQVYLNEGFEGTFSGNPSAPSGWTQTRLVLMGDGNPEYTVGEKDWQKVVNTGAASWTSSPTPWTSTAPSITCCIYPNAAHTGSSVLGIHADSFGSTGSSFGNRRMESPAINLSGSTSPYVRFWLHCASYPFVLNFKVVASNDGGVTWNQIMMVAPYSFDSLTFSSSTAWQKINVKIPPQYKVANSKFGVEIALGIIPNVSVANRNCFIDDFSVEEFTPVIVTSVATGSWTSPSTWSPAIVPDADNDVVIAATHTVINNQNFGYSTARVQNVTVNGVLNAPGQWTQIFGDLNINNTGTYNCKTNVTYLGGNFVNNGFADFYPSTSNDDGTLVWCGHTGSYSGTGTFSNARIPNVIHIAPGGVQYLDSMAISSSCHLVLGQVSGSKLILGRSPVFTLNYNIIRFLGSFTGNPPLFNHTNITNLGVSYKNSSNASSKAIWLLAAPLQTIVPGDEIELVLGNRQTDAIKMDTYNNVELNFPITTKSLDFTRGIITTNSVNLLTVNGAPSQGVAPSVIICNGTNNGTQGSYVNGPLKINFPMAVGGMRNFPIGQGAAFHNNYPSSNVLRGISLIPSGSMWWNGQAITATMEGAPTGTFTGSINSLIGTRAYRLNKNGGNALPAQTTITLTANNSTFGGSDNLSGNLQNLRIVHAAALSGTWTERSNSSGSGAIPSNMLVTRSSTSLSTMASDEYFAWGSTAPTCSGTPVANTIVSNGIMTCAGSAVTLNLSQTYTTTGFTYQWGVASSSSGPFAPISGATANSHAINSLSATAWYNCVITCPNGGASTTVTSLQLLVPASTTSTVPYFEGFEGIVADNYLPNCSWTTATPEVCQTNTTLGNSGPKCGVFGAYPTVNYPVSDYYFFTNGIQLNTGITYSASIFYRAGSNFYNGDNWYEFNLLYGTTQIPSGLTSITSTISSVGGVGLFTNSLYSQLTNTFTVSGSGIYYLAIKARGKRNVADFLKFDDISITAPCSLNPAQVPTLSVTGPSIICSGQSLSLTASGASSYSWSTGSTSSGISVTPSVNTTYTVTGTGPLLNCIATEIKTITVNPSPSLAITGQSFVCSGQSVNLTATGAGSYTWNTGANTSNIFFFPTVSGSYSVAGTATNGCVNSVTFGVIVNPLPTITVNSGSVCAGESFTIVPAGASVYNYSGGSAIVTPTTSGNYSVTGTNAQGCISSNTAICSITVQASPTISVNSGSICSGSFFIITPIGGINYTYSGGSNSVSPLSNTSYTVTGSNPAGCSNFAIATVSVMALPTISVNSGAICLGNSFTMVPSGAISYSFSNGSAILTPTTSASYSVTGTDSNGCVSSSPAIAQVTVKPNPILVIIGNNSFCINSGVTQTATGAVSYTWNTGVNTNTILLTPTITTSYTVAGTGTNNCIGSQVKTITVHPLPVLSFVTSKVLLCEGETATINVSGANTYTWSTTVTGSSITISPAVTTSYSVAATDTNSCSSSAAFSQTVDACVGVVSHIFSMQKQTEIYPNPNRGEFIVSLNSRQENAFVEIFNSLGELIIKTELESELTNISLKGFANGIYIARIFVNNNSVSQKKIIKE